MLFLETIGTRGFHVTSAEILLLFEVRKLTYRIMAPVSMTVAIGSIMAKQVVRLSPVVINEV